MVKTTSTPCLSSYDLANRLSVVSKPAAEKNAEIQKRNDGAQGTRIAPLLLYDVAQATSEMFQNAQKGKVVCVECARVIGADEVCTSHLAVAYRLMLCARCSIV